MDYRAAAKAALEKRANLVSELRSVNDDSTLSDAEKRERVERLDAEVNGLEAEAREAVERGEREAEVRSLTARADGLFAPNGDRQEQRNAEGLDEQFRAVARGEARGFEIESDGSEMRTATTGSAANAGTTIQSTFVREVMQSLRDSSPFMQSGVRIVTSQSGEKMEWPVKNGRLIASKVAENGVYPKSDMSFTRWEIDSHKVGVIAEATEEMLNDGALPLASLIAEDMGEAIADETGEAWLKGTGTGEANGLLPAITLNAGTLSLASTGTTASDKVVELQHAIISKYRRNAYFYTSDAGVLFLRKLKDADGRYLWQPATTAGQPDTFLGKPITTDPNMSWASGQVGLVFGDFSKYLVRFVRSVQITRSDEYGYDRDVVAWKARLRYDGGVTDGAAFAKLTLGA
ncbi:phage major capsid protein [Streptomyces sp. MBT56]|uniref:phage major capsid protein n=1 Tax=unclassified Streptomyces TaxID=2593676 RepID=UPI00190D4B24|nr:MULTISPECIES: phage major capsid protein [unclassified Streptomyces]MBK3559317.1 phage major capsid protein [Streptomyces sp. MBT56]MBK3601040.1 phage major capsid protein [Streptomyces sp. MBT54]MBK3613946.1 phage major capsid protein [Streptomyces sp. MBT98]MBK6041989.1 phage major capsid protein [Streptomyces sp. MBT55]